MFYCTTTIVILALLLLLRFIKRNRKEEFLKDLRDRRLPSVLPKQRCMWVYKSAACGYTGDLESCNKSFRDCKFHFENAVDRFGGFPTPDAFIYHYQDSDQEFQATPPVEWRTAGRIGGFSTQEILESIHVFGSLQIGDLKFFRSDCKYFNNNPYLKCAVGTDCRGCRDFEEKQ